MPGDADIAPGTTIGHYRIESVLGGGMGVVYRAVDIRLNRPVAIKFLSSDVFDAEDRSHRGRFRDRHGRVVPEQPNLHAAAKMLAARTFAWVGEGDAAVDLLERLAVDEPGLSPGGIARQPWYTVPLRDHSRFRALVARLEAQMAATTLE